MPSRYRVKTDTQSTGTYYMMNQVDANPPTVYSQETQVISKAFHDMSDVVTPDFKKKSARGEIVNSPMVVTKHLFSAGGGSYNAVNGGSRYYSSGDGSLTLSSNPAIGTPFTSPTVPDISSYLADAKLQAIKNIDKSPYALMEDLLEGHKTLSMLRHPLGDALRLSRQFSSDRAKTASEAWLYYRFGIGNLLRSASDLWKSFETVKKYPIRQTSRGFSELSRSVSETPTYNFGVGSNTWTHDINQTCKVRAGILYHVTNPVDTWRESVGLRAKDIPVTMWAICPYSWIIDRFVDLSGSIKGLTNLLDPSVEILTGWTTTETITLETTQLINQSRTDGWSVSALGDVVTDYTYTKQRVGWSPTINDVIPGFRSGFHQSATEISDLIAMIVKGLSSRR